METFVGHGGDQSAATVALMARHEYRLQVQAFFANDQLGNTSLSFVKSRPAHLQNTAALLNRNGLLLQRFNDLMSHFISRAKKADAFFNIVTSCRSC